jgi:hypothetical protein
MKNVVLWEVAPCRSSVNRRSRGAFAFSFRVEKSSETSVHRKSTRRRIPEDGILQIIFVSVHAFNDNLAAGGPSREERYWNRGRNWCTLVSCLTSSWNIPPNRRLSVKGLYGVISTVTELLMSTVSIIWNSTQNILVSFLLALIQSQRRSQSYFKNGGLPPIIWFWWQAPWDSRHSNFIFQLNTYGYSPYVTSSLWFTIAAGSRQRSHSQVRVPRDSLHILLSQIRGPPPNLEGKSPYS